MNHRQSAVKAEALTFVAALILELADVINLSQCNKAISSAIKKLREVRSVKPRGGAEFVGGLLKSFDELKLLQIDAAALDFSCFRMILCKRSISLLHAYNVICRAQRDPLIPLLNHLKRLDIAGCNYFIMDVVARCDGTALEELMIKDNIYLKTPAINRLLHSFKVLHTLQLSNLMGLESITIDNSMLQRSLKTLIITHCRFFSRIHVPPYSQNWELREGYEPLRLFESLMSIDLSCTSVAVSDVEGMVSASPHLRTLVVKECLTIGGAVMLRSSSLRCADFQFCTNLCELSLKCPALESADVRGCLSLVQLVVTSFQLESLGLAMLSRLSELDVSGCARLTRLDLSGCGSLPSHHWGHPAVPPEAMMYHALAPDDDGQTVPDVNDELSTVTDALKNVTIEPSPHLLRHHSFTSDASTDTNASEKSEGLAASNRFKGGRYRRKSRRSASL